MIARKLVQIVPAHGIQVGLANLARKHRLVAVKKGKEVPELEEILLLNYLGIDIGRPKGLDLGDEEVAYPLDGLRELALRPGRR